MIVRASTRPRRAVAFGALLFVSLAATPSHAGDSKIACATAAEDAQALRHDAKLRAAREQLLVCARQGCPDLVKVDCQRWLAEVDSALPTIVVRARDARGNDVFGVRVSVDGQTITNALDGKAVPIDPGPHRFRYEVSGAEPVELDLLVTEGEHNRLVIVSFRAALRSDGSRDEVSPPNAAPPVPRPEAPVSVPPSTEASSTSTAASPPLPIGPLIVGGIGVLSIGAFAILDASAWSDVHALRDGCGRTRSCAQSEVDSVDTRITIAKVALGAGLAGVAAGVTWFVLTRTPASSGGVRASVGLRMLPAGAAGEATLAF